jgi:hypothetical protein
MNRQFLQQEAESVEKLIAAARESARVGEAAVKPKSRSTGKYVA